MFKIGIDTKRNTGATDPTDPYVPKGSETVATKIVAADGSAEFTDIQQAIDALPASGGVVYIKEGTYVLTDKITVLKSNVTIRGAGRSTIIQGIDDVNQKVFVLGSASVPVVRITIDNCQITGNSGFGISLIKGSSCIFQNCHLISLRTYGIYADDNSSGLMIFNCHFHTMNYGVDIHANSATIIGCVFNECNYAAIRAFASHYTVISGNTIWNDTALVSGDGIRVVYSDWVSVVGNSMYSKTGSGISLVESDNDVVTGNTAFYSAVDGILVDDSNFCTITANNFTGNTNYGINLSNSTSDNNVVTGNVCRLNVAGQINDGGTGTQIAHNITS